MKLLRKFAAALLAALVLTGCAQTKPGETTEPTAKAPIVPTTAPTTAPTETTVAPTEPEPQVLEPALWWREAQHPSYEEALAEPAAFCLSDTEAWLISEGDSAVCYSLENYFPDGYFIASSAHQKIYTVPGSETLSADYVVPIAADMEFAYLASDSAVLKLDLLTGETAASVSCGKILASAVMDHYMLYYAEHTGEAINICRVYLPEMKRDVLDSLEAPAKIYEDDNTGALSGNGKLRWAIRNPEMMELLEAELKNPESSYQKAVFNEEEVDFSFVWTREDPLEERALNDLDMFLYTVQEKSGIRAFAEYEYDLKAGQLSVRTAIIDSCYFGTGKPHDHELPEITEIDGPTVVNGPWNPTPGWDIQGTVTGKPSGSFSVEQRRFGTGPVKLYLKENGYLTEIAEMSLQNMQLRDDGIWGITQDNRVVQLSYDGTVCNTLYAGSGALKDIIYLEKGFYLVDNGQLVEVDAEAGKYRVLVKQEHMWDIDYWSKQEGTLYFLASHGLAYQQHKYDPATGTIERVSVMW